MDDVGEVGALGLVPSGARVHLALEVSLDDILRVPTEQRDGDIVEGIKDHRAIQPYSPSAATVFGRFGLSGTPAIQAGGIGPRRFRERHRGLRGLAAGCGDGFVERPVNQ